MEQVLDVYKQSYDPLYPVVCMDESPKQLIAEKRKPIAAKPGQVARYFIATEPLMGKRLVRVAEQRTKQDETRFLEEITKHFPSMKRSILQRPVHCLIDLCL